VNGRGHRTDKQTDRQTDKQTDTSTDNKGRLDLSGDARANTVTEIQ